MFINGGLLVSKNVVLRQPQAPYGTCSGTL
jgi:hypothetical protein